MGVLVAFPGLMWVRLGRENEQMILAYNENSKRIVLDFEKEHCLLGKDIGAVVSRLLMQGWTEEERIPMNEIHKK